jgi:hypothetical protein
VAPSLQAKQRTLKFNLARANLHHGLENRPSLKEIADKGILTQEDLEAADAGEAVRACAAYVPRAAVGPTHAYTGYQEGGDAGAGGVSAPLQELPPHAHSAQVRRGHVRGAFRLVCARMCALASRWCRLLSLSSVLAAGTAQAGEISLQQKGFLKDLIVDQDPVVLRIAEVFDADNNYAAVRTHAHSCSCILDSSVSPSCEA